MIKVVDYVSFWKLFFDIGFGFRDCVKFIVGEEIFRVEIGSGR